MIHTMEYRSLGNTGLTVSRAGFGVLPMGPAQLALPVEEGAQLLVHAIKQGINFIDTAQYYQTYPYIRRALEILNEQGGEAARTADNLVICSKSLTDDYDDMMAAIEEARRELNRDVIHIFLMHEVRSGQLQERQGAWQALIDARKRGLMKAIGLSTHHVSITEAAARMTELDVVFPLLNYAGLGIRTENPDGSERFASAAEMMDAIRLCRTAGKGVFTMKAFGGGSLTAHYQQALDFVFSQPEADSVMLGFGRKSEIDDLMAYLNGTMPSDFNPDISHKRVHVNQEDCEGCGACKSACPAGAIFWSPDTGLAEVDQKKCLTCGYCIPCCPVRAVIMY